MRNQRKEYDLCAINTKNIDKQCTILWHVEDLEFSHVHPGIASSVFADIGTEYGIIEKMTITRIKLHKYLEITID